MILRIINFVVIGALVLAAAYVYRIKFNSTVQAERLAKIRSEVRHERDVIAALRAKWGELDNPARIQMLAKRFLKLQPIAPTQFDTFDNLPARPTPMVTDNSDPIGGLIENFERPPLVTGSIAEPADPAAPKPSPATSDTQSDATPAPAADSSAGPAAASGAPNQ